MDNKVVIYEITDEEGLYEECIYSVHFEGAAEDYGYDDITDYLSDSDAYEVALQVAEAQGSEIIWLGTKPDWC